MLHNLFLAIMKISNCLHRRDKNGSLNDFKCFKDGVSTVNIDHLVALQKLNLTVSKTQFWIELLAGFATLLLINKISYQWDFPSSL